MMRRWMNLLEAALRPVAEMYSADNSRLRNYLNRPGDADHYAQWYLVCEWLENNDYLDEMSDLLGHDITSADDLQEEEPEVFERLPEEVRQRCLAWVTDYLVQHDPAEAPTSAYMGLASQKLLPRQTWLVHFSDEARQIAEQGFTRGVDDVGKLGLTTYLSDFDKAGGGYNFAFVADSRDAVWAAKKGKYGNDAVLFQNSGVRCSHYGDEETQIVFWGEDVKPRDTILLRHGDDWTVRAKHTGAIVFHGEYQDCVAWVALHFAQYRRVLTGF